MSYDIQKTHVEQNIALKMFAVFLSPVCLSVCLSLCLSVCLSVFSYFYLSSFSYFLLFIFRRAPIFGTEWLVLISATKNPYNCCLPRHYIFTTNWYESIFFFLCYMTIQQSTIGHDHCWWGFIWKLESFL